MPETTIATTESLFGRLLATQIWSQTGNFRIPSMKAASFGKQARHSCSHSPSASNVNSASRTETTSSSAKIGASPSKEPVVVGLSSSALPSNRITAFKIWTAVPLDSLK